MAMNTDKLFFTSDDHFLHDKVLLYASRPFKTVKEMNETLIKNWNSVVPEDGVVYNLGDVALGRTSDTLEILNRLNGSIYLVSGNHEKTVLKRKILRDRFVAIYDHTHILDIVDQDAIYSNGVQQIILSHFVYQVWRNKQYGSWHLHGHMHNELPTPNNILRLDVGVDSSICNFTPISYNQVKAHMNTKNFVPLKHVDDLIISNS